MVKYINDWACASFHLDFLRFCDSAEWTLPGFLPVFLHSESPLWVPDYGPALSYWCFSTVSPTLLSQQSLQVIAFIIIYRLWLPISIGRQALSSECQNHITNCLLDISTCPLQWPKPELLPSIFKPHLTPVSALWKWPHHQPNYLNQTLSSWPG